MPSFQVNTKWAAMSEVVPGLYLSGVSALNPIDIQALKINCVINCTEEVPNLRSLSGDVDRIKLWLEDTETADITQHLDVVADQIHVVMNLGGRVLVHCVAGVSRSASFVLAYLLKYSPLTRSLREAFHLLASRRPLVRPNLGFWRQLIDYEFQLKGRTTVRILDSVSSDTGTPQRVPDVYLRELVPGRESPGPVFRVGGSESPEPPLCLDKENSPVLPLSYGEDPRERRGSGQKMKFTPSLASLPEIEAT